MKRLLCLFLVIILNVSLLSLPTNATSNQPQAVKVQIAPFSTEIQYLTVDNRSVEYPLITYKGITYFPMTYYLCERLGLEATYNPAQGLYITCGNISSSNDTDPFFGESAVNPMEITYEAYIANYPVYLNGIYIDNSKEEYPLLNFRNITYFPMTWHFAYEELNFNIEWSYADYSFKLHTNGRGYIPYVYSDDGNNLQFQNKISVYDRQDDSYTLSYSYWEQYSFDLNSQQMVRLENTAEGHDSDIPRININVTDASIKSDGIYMNDTPVLNMDTTEVTNATATEHKMDSSSFIAMYVQFGNAPAPYTQHQEYLLYKDNTGIKKLDWDVKNNLSGIYPDRNGGYYIASSGYSVAQSSRWTNPFSDVYYYTPEGDSFISLSETHTETLNSIRAIGATNDKLYVQAMLYNANKQQATDYSHHFSASNSGYYEINLTDGSMKKLYPYISGEAFVASDGNLYCVADYARMPRLINLCTGLIIPFK